MTLQELVKKAVASSYIKALAKDVRPSKTELTDYAGLIGNEVAARHDWDFVLSQADKTTVADQAEYTLKGNANDCRDVVNIRYQADGVTSFSLLERKRPVDMDAFLSNRDVTGVGWWYVSGRDSSGFPKVTIIDPPAAAGETLRYRYRKNNIGVAEFPDEFWGVLLSCLIGKFVPSQVGLYEKLLRIMIDRYAVSGGEANPARLDPKVVQLNNKIGGLYGY